MLEKIFREMDVMKLTGYVLFLGVYFIQYVAPHPAIELRKVDEVSPQFRAQNKQHAKTLENRTDDLQNVLTSKETEKHASTLFSPRLEIPSPMKNDNDDETENQKQNGGRNGFAKLDQRAQADFHNLSVLEYLEEFNASNIQDRNEINDYYTIQSRMEDHDASGGRSDLNEGNEATRTNDKNKQINLDLRNMFEKEFLEHHRHSKGKWEILAKCTTDQRVELCKEAHRRIRDDHKSNFQITEQQFQPMNVKILGGEVPLTTELLKCSVRSPAVKWNGLAISKNSVFYLSEGSSLTEVFKLLPALNNDEVYVGGKITQIKYPRNLG